MKLVRYGDVGLERPGLIDCNGELRDLSGRVADISPETLDDRSLAALSSDWEALPKVVAPQRLGCPVSRIGKFVAIGLNYADHAAESGQPIPLEPVVFLKRTAVFRGRTIP